MTLESNRHIPCAVSLQFADSTWNVPAYLAGKVSAIGLTPPRSEASHPWPREAYLSGASSFPFVLSPRIPNDGGRGSGREH